MATLYTEQSKNIRKTWTLVFVFLIVVISVGYFISLYYGRPDILLFAVVFALGMNIFAYWNSSKMVLKMSGAKKASREEYFDLYTLTENLAITAGLPMPQLYVIHDDAPNAFATGRNEKHAVVAVTTGLLSLLEKDELEGVVAHELAHIGNKDMLISTMVVVLVGFITLLSDFFLRSLLFRGRGRDSDSQLGSIFMIVGIALMILAPIIGILIQLSISRKREYLADASGALLTRYPDGLANALEKISHYGGKMKIQNKAIAHLFISNPFGAKKSLSGISKMFSTHPPLQERVQRLRKEM
ncbi:MAG: heat shock protein HtpX [Flavobacteriaceae bacterium]|jgi:heat shock protein HtpX